MTMIDQSDIRVGERYLVSHQWAGRFEATLKHVDGYYYGLERVVNGVVTQYALAKEVTTLEPLPVESTASESRLSDLRKIAKQIGTRGVIEELISWTIENRPSTSWDTAARLVTSGPWLDIRKFNQVPVESNEPTAAQIESACRTFRPTYEFMYDAGKISMRHEALQWLRAWRKESAWTKIE